MSARKQSNAPDGAAADAERSFEKSLERLEEIVGQMESGSLKLDEMLARFEEGRELVKFCTAKLNEVERRIEILVKKGDETVAEPFEPEAEAPAAEPGRSELL